MEKVYADLIKKGKKTLEEVPAKLREKVKKLLNGQLLILYHKTIFQKGCRNYGSCIRNINRKGQKDIGAGTAAAEGRRAGNSRSTGNYPVEGNFP